MNALVAALIAELGPEELQALADKLAPYLQQPNTDNGWLRGADQIADYIGAPRSRIYAMTSAGRLPAVQRDGTALVARKSDLDEYIRNGGARRP